MQPIRTEEDEHMHYIGLIASKWAELEFYIDLTSCVIGDIKTDVGFCFAANIQSIHAKLRTLNALLESRGFKQEVAGYEKTQEVPGINEWDRRTEK